MERFFLAIYNYFEKHKGRMWIAAICSFLFFGFFASRMKLEEDITSILPHEKKLDRQQQVFRDRLSDKLTLSVSQKDTTSAPAPDELTVFADTFLAKINADLPGYIKSVEGVNDSLMANMMAQYRRPATILI